jgi:hypothetical protein
MMMMATQFHLKKLPVLHHLMTIANSFPHLAS